MKQVNCTIPDCPNFGRYCKLHYGFTPEKEKTPIKAKSDKRKEIDNKEYYPATKRFLVIHAECELKMEGCTRKATCVHHTKGKDSIEMLLNERHWKGSCYHCNLLVEILDAEARQKDLKLSKFNDHPTNQ